MDPLFPAVPEELEALDDEQLSTLATQIRDRVTEVVQGSPRDVHAVGERTGAVVETGQDVGMQIDHRSTI